MDADELRAQIEKIRAAAGLEAVGIAVHDFENARHFSLEGERWFHAASTMKVAILLTLFHAAQTGAARLDDRLHVRNRFRSIADESVFRVESERDADDAVHGRIGRSMKLVELAHAMITRSSNLATNLLFDYLTRDAIQRTLDTAEVAGVRVARGVEDTAAFDRGLNNEITADGLVQMFARTHAGDFFQADSRRGMLEILLAQQFNSMIPALLPGEAKVAHKTGEISTCTHDAGLVFPANRRPYAVAILTQHASSADAPAKAVAKISRAIYDFVNG